MKFGRCIESYVITVYAVNHTGKIYNALRKFGTLEFVRCMGENVVNGVRSNEVRLYSEFINHRKKALKCCLAFLVAVMRLHALARVLDNGKTFDFFAGNSDP